ncbi:hypothetical protein ENUP19_0358G0021 [Entamoeba nuttalli]|uniref:Uncharacterized protein n=1 Tax=Entamoeba nuttalli TaxID=412467 RepID=A0ABQ0DGI8_9EUKA
MEEKKPKWSLNEPLKTITVFESKEVLPVEVSNQRNKKLLKRKEEITEYKFNEININDEQINDLLTTELFGSGYYKYFYELSFSTEKVKRFN